MLPPPTPKAFSALADDTRYAIYWHLWEHGDDGSTAGGVAVALGIHPNVARMHLARLEDAGVCRSRLVRDGAGGRPPRCYTLSEASQDLSVPPRDYPLFSVIAADALAMLGGPAREALADAAHRRGRELGRRRLRAEALDQAGASREELTASFSALLAEEWVRPEVRWDGLRTLTVQLGHCPFRELANVQQDVTCPTHFAYIAGIASAYFGDVTVEAGPLIPQGSERCVARLNLAAPVPA